MQNIHIKWKKIHKTLGIMVLCLCFAMPLAMADGVMPIMPPPPDVPVYWQLVSVEELPEERPTGRFSLDAQTDGLSLDLDDGLMAESILQEEDTVQGISLSFTKDGEVVMAHDYSWTPLPIYLEPGVEYPITVTGTKEAGERTPNSLLGVYVQGDLAARISAGGYTEHADSATFTISTESGVYKDGSYVVSFILRDVNDMYRNRIVYTYQMNDGVKPVPTPVPGFVPVEVPEDAVPDYYMPIEGREDLWQVVTAPEEIRAYGSMSGSTPGFFPADAEGNVVMNEVPAEPEKDYAAYVKGFVATEPVEVPAYYTAEDGLYTFITRDGETVARAYGRIDGGEPAFYPVDAEGNVGEAAEAVDPADDFDAYIKGFGNAEPATAYSFYSVDENVYAFTGRDGSTYYRAYGRLDGAAPAFYPSDEEGKVAEGATPVTPEDDFEAYIKGFDAASPDTVPEHYSVVEGNVYAIEDEKGETQYRVYGVKDGEAPAFYPADAEGNILEDAKPVTPEDDFDAYVAGFVQAQAPEVPDFYEETDVPGVWSFEDKDGQVQYRAYGELNRTEGTFYPSDAQGNVKTDALPVQPAADRTTLAAPFFVTATPEEVPAYYEAVEGKEGLYTFTTKAGETLYRVYGGYGKAAPLFYPADEQGNPVPDAEPSDTAAEFNELVIGFVPRVPEEIPAYYSQVSGLDEVFAFEMEDGSIVYRVFGKADDGSIAFFPADEDGNIINFEPVNLKDDEAKLKSPFVAAVVTLAPTPEAANTPIARTMDAPSNWPEPENATDEPTGIFTPGPDATASPLPEGFKATVVGGSIDSTSTPQVISRVVDYPETVEPEETDDVTSAPETAEAATDTPETDTPATEEPQPTEEATEPVADPTTVAPSQEPEPAEKGGLSTGWWIVIAGVAVVIIGGVLYVVNKKKDK